MSSASMTFDSCETGGRLLIGDEWRDTAHRQPNLNPSDLDEVLQDYAWASVADVEDGLDSARHSLKSWAHSNPQLRCDILRKAGDLIAARADEIAFLLSREQGKTVNEARGEVMRASQIFHFFSGEPVRVPGKFLPSVRPGFNVIVDYEPVGVVALITPSNFPVATPAWKIAPALAFGNTIVYKPAETTPASATAMVQVLIDAGLPPGVINLVMGDGGEICGSLIDGADAVSFTGATRTGQIVLERAARTMTKIQLELGGKNPLVVMDDADLENAVDIALDGSYAHAGQRCTASSRLIIHRSIHDEFVGRLTKKVAALKVGHALAPDTGLGPVASAAQLGKNLDFVAGAVKEGGQLLCGGTTLERTARGYYFAPALLADTNNQMTINRQEVFGPVATVIPASDLDEAIVIANDTDYGLSAGICTRSLATTERFRRASTAGMVVVNAPTAGVEYHAPFGGRTPSGYGAREQGTSALEFYTEIKTSYINHGVI